MNPDRRDELLELLEPDAIEHHRANVSAALRAAAAAGNLLIVGSAHLPQKVARAIQDEGGRVAAFAEFDPRFWGRKAAGLPVLALDEALTRTGPDPMAVVGIWSPRHVYAETRAWLQAAGIQQIVPVNAAFWTYAKRLGPHYQFGAPCLYGERRDDILRLYDRLGDDESKHQFAGILRYRVTLEPESLPKPEYKRSYFDPSVSCLGPDAVVADIGAFSGDTLDIFLYWQGTRFRRFVAIEPDPISFERLVAFRNSLPSAVADRIECIHAAMGERRGLVRVSPSGMPGAKSTDEGDVEIPCLAIDEMFDGQPLDFIKVDVEGAEPQVIAGAWRTIERTRPTIGLSVYHSPDDIFALPLQLIDRLHDYEFRFRAHDFDGIDFVFYAVPRERAPLSTV
jgi:FkbM family methyltransferase